MANLSPLAISQHSDSYWRATFDNPPLNLIDPETILALRALMDTLEAVNVRTGVPSGEDLTEAATVFRHSGTWPGTRQRVRDALAQSLQQRGDFELNQGARLGPAA